MEAASKMKFKKATSEGRKELSEVTLFPEMGNRRLITRN